MPTLEDVFKSQKTYSPDEYDSIPPEEKIEITKALYNKIIEILLSSKHPQLVEIAQATRDTIVNSADSPKGLIRLIGTDSYGALENIMDKLGIPEDFRADFFGVEMQQLTEHPNPETYNIYATAPLDTLLSRKYGQKLTKFMMLTAVIINTNIIQLIDNPRKLLFYFVSEMSFMADCYKLQSAIAKEEVYIVSLNSIYERIMERSYAAAKAALEELNEETGTTSLAGLQIGLQKILETVDNIEDYGDVSELFKHIPKSN